MGKKKRIRQKQRLVNYFNEQSGACAYCHDDMTLDLGYTNTATIDHVQPRVYGGKSGEFNEVAACYDCNARKSSMDVVDFLKLNAALSKPNVIPFPQTQKPGVA